MVTIGDFVQAKRTLTGKVLEMDGMGPHAKTWRIPDAGTHGNVATAARCLLNGTARKNQQVRLVDQVMLRNQKKYPTPTQRDYKSGKGKSQKERGRHPGSASLLEKCAGTLNPDWVEWLMGWPRFWSDTKPTKELMWLSWDKDPAAGEGLKCWATPNYSARSGRNKNTGKGEGLYYQVREKGTGKTGLIPRVTTKKENRINRLKAIGNGQVPQCMATAWELLTNF